jgi:hypothetical protein
MRLAKSLLTSMAAIAIQDDANVARHWSAFDLTQQATFVDPIQETL